MLYALHVHFALLHSHCKINLGEAVSRCFRVCLHYCTSFIGISESKGLLLPGAQMMLFKKEKTKKKAYKKSPNH